MIVAQPIAPYHLTPTRPPYVEVLVDCPGSEKLFTYAIPEELEVEPGDILSVPFGSQQVGAIAIGFRSSPPPDLDPTRIKAVDDIITRGFFPPHYWQLLEQVADYYYTPLMQVIRVALPPDFYSDRNAAFASTPRRLPLVQNSSFLLSPAGFSLFCKMENQTTIAPPMYSKKFLEPVEEFEI